MPTSNLIVAMGDSVTKGVREGVTESQIYTALLETALRQAGQPIRVISQGIGGENTDDARQRISHIIALKPQVVTLMYGINDSALDDGRTEPRVSVLEYRRYLEELIGNLCAAGIKPVLMTPNPMANSGITQTLYGAHEPYRSQGINFLLEQYAAVVREIGAEQHLPVIDIYAAFAARSHAGEDIAGYLTDGMHPNPAGHEIIAEALAAAQLTRYFADSPKI